MALVGLLWCAAIARDASAGGSSREGKWAEISSNAGCERKAAQPESVPGLQHPDRLVRDYDSLKRWQKHRFAYSNVVILES